MISRVQYLEVMALYAERLEPWPMGRALIREEHSLLVTSVPT